MSTPSKSTSANPKTPVTPPRQASSGKEKEEIPSSRHSTAPKLPEIDVGQGDMSKMQASAPASNELSSNAGTGDDPGDDPDGPFEDVDLSDRAEAEPSEERSVARRSLTANADDARDEAAYGEARSLRDDAGKDFEIMEKDKSGHRSYNGQADHPRKYT